MDPMVVAAAAIMIIGGVGSLVVQVFNAYAGAKERIIAASHRAELTLKAELAASKVEEVARNAGAIAVRADATASTIEAIKHTTETSAKNIDGNLTAVRADLERSRAHSEALQHTVDMLIATLKDSRPQSGQSSGGGSGGAGGVVAAPVKVEVVNEPLLTEQKPSRPDHK